MPAAAQRGRLLWRRVPGPAVLLSALLAACPPAWAGEVTVTILDGRYDVEIAAPVPAADLAAALASAAGAAVLGDPGQDSVAPAHSHGLSLERTLARLLPHRPFAVRWREGGGQVAAIVFPGATRPDQAGPVPAPATRHPAPAVPGLPPLPDTGRDAFIRQLPMLKTH